MNNKYINKTILLPFASVTGIINIDGVAMIVYKKSLSKKILVTNVMAREEGKILFNKIGNVDEVGFYYGSNLSGHIVSGNLFTHNNCDYNMHDFVDGDVNFHIDKNLLQTIIGSVNCDLRLNVIEYVGL
jgi:hypothetical protein